MDAPQYKQPPLDPVFMQLMAQSQQQDIEAIQQRAQGDTASILARYGSNLARAQSTSASGATPLMGV